MRGKHFSVTEIMQMKLKINFKQVKSTYLYFNTRSELLYNTTSISLYFEILLVIHPQTTCGNNSLVLSTYQSVISVSQLSFSVSYT